MSCKSTNSIGPVWELHIWRRLLMSNYIYTCWITSLICFYGRCMKNAKLSGEEDFHPSWAAQARSEAWTFVSKMIHWAQSAKLAPKASLDLVVIIVMVVMMIIDATKSINVWGRNWRGLGGGLATVSWLTLALAFHWTPNNINPFVPSSFQSVVVWDMTR